MRHVTHLNGSCHWYDWVTSHMNYTNAWVMSHMNESCHIWMSRVTYEWIMSHRMSHVTYESHLWMSHVTYACVMSHPSWPCHISWKSLVTYEWHTWMSHLIHAHVTWLIHRFHSSIMTMSHFMKTSCHIPTTQQIEPRHVRMRHVASIMTMSHLRKECHIRHTWMSRRVIGVVHMVTSHLMEESCHTQGGDDS